MEIGLGFNGPDVPDGLEKAAVLEPIPPFQGCVFDRFEAAPWTATMDCGGMLQRSLVIHFRYQMMGANDGRTTFGIPPVAGCVRIGGR